MSRFVSAGTEEEPTEHDEAWRKAQEQIEATRRERAEIGKQDGGKSLYETLQANKAAKQEAFEESIRLRNQFRSLDEDEVEFLDSVLEGERAKEAALKKQTAVELDAFKKQREEAEQASKLAAISPNSPEDAGTTSWTVGKKRKKARGDILGGAKLRKSSTGDRASTGPDKSPTSPPQIAKDGKPTLANPGAPPTVSSGSEKQAPVINETHAIVKPDAKPASPTTAPDLGLGLGAYSSDED